MTIVDSSVWIDYLLNRPTAEVTWLHHHMLSERTGLTDLILYEVLRGVRDDARFAELREELQHYEVWPTLMSGVEVKAARNFRALRKRGITIRKSIDCLIATFCIEGQHELLHNDRDFDPFEEHLNLKVIHPETRRN